MIETRQNEIYDAAYRQAHQLRAETLAQMVRHLFSQPSAARPFRVVTTEKGAGSARPAPCIFCG
ncbi:MAG: hypothetical protein KDE08_08920 [Rhodobacteraceae bacterium]|nr:hypothetical protein [Paracoccaceae bacterium]